MPEVNQLTTPNGYLLKSNLKGIAVTSLITGPELQLCTIGITTVHSNILAITNSALS
jgi:hypothetical protein